MAKTAPNKKLDLQTPVLDQGGVNFFPALRGHPIKQALVLAGIGLFITLAIYSYLRIGQETIIRQKFKTAEPQTTIDENALAERQKKFSLDQQRKNDVTTVNSALKSYFLEKGSAPENLSELLPKPLAALPRDPQTGKDYVYTQGEDKKSWKLSATLSDDKLFELSGP